MILEVRQCQHCGARENLHIQSTRKNKNGTTKVYFMCRSCKATRLSQYSRSPKGRKVRARINKKQKECYPDKARARGQINMAIYLGKLTKPSSCTICLSSGRIEGHHSDYAKPMDVIWLCVPCHNNYHR